MAAISPHTSTIIVSQHRSSLSCPPRFSSTPNPLSSSSSTNHPLSFTKLSVSSPSFSSSSVAKTVPPVEIHDSDGIDSDSSNLSSGWAEFASKVSGEWDGHGADFTIDGNPVELPESVVPGAYREWDVQVFDWQTQCPTLAVPESISLSYRMIRLLPTVGCEADAATIYDVDERNVGGEGSGALAFGYHSGGNYVAVWSLGVKGKYKLLELEHCLIDPNNRESRVRVVQVVRVDDTKLRLQRIKVFCEQWYGPFRNGEQLGGCAIRDSGFASTAALAASEVKGVWQSFEAVSRFHTNMVEELVSGRTKKLIRDENDLIVLPRQLWCSFKENEDGEFCGEVGWLLKSGSAMSSRVIYSSILNVKEMAMGYETAVTDL